MEEILLLCAVLVDLDTRHVAAQGMNIIAFRDAGFQGVLVLAGHLQAVEDVKYFLSAGVKLVDPVAPGVWWGLPVVAETYDGSLNDINGFHVTKAHAVEALNRGVKLAGCLQNTGEGGIAPYHRKGGYGLPTRLLVEWVLSRTR